MMTVEILNVSLEDKVIHIEAIDISEENLMRLERRDDGCERELQFVFDTREKKACQYLISWLHRQKAAKGCRTYGEALRAVEGTRTQINGKYIVWDF